MRSARHPFAALLLAGAAPAQLPGWVALPVPAPARTFVEAHIAVVQEPGAVHAFSTFTRRWTRQPTSSPSAQFFGFDDHVIVQDGNVFYGYASRFGAFVPLQAASPTPFVLTMPSSSLLSVVVDGSTIRAFSPFTGAWSSLTTTASGAVSAGKMAAVFADGPRVYGYSPLYGQFVPLQAAASITSATAGGYCAHATDGLYHYAFSGIRNAWTTLPSAANAAVAAGTGRHGHLVLTDGATVDLYSGITGRNTRLLCVNAPAITRSEQVVVLQDSPFTYAWSAITGTTGTLVTVNPPAVTAQNYFALLQDGTDLHTFSAATGAFAPVLQGSWSTIASLNAALATDAQGRTKAYSALQNRWVDGPAGAFMPTVTQGSVVLLDPAGMLHGFSVRTGAWSGTATGTVDTTFTFGSNFCARAGNDLYAFNERYGRWSHTATPVPANVRLHQQTIVADAGAWATAYSVWNDDWSARPLAGAPASVAVADDSGLVQDGSGLFAFGGSCQVSTLALYPEWWRFMCRGTPNPFHVAGEPGAGAFLVLGFDAAALTIPGIRGELGVAPGSAVSFFGVLPASGMWVLPSTVPELPALVGCTVHAQALVLGPAGPYFTSVYPTTIL